ncbi:hypothetical protein [Sphingobacterium griseoflavum]|uniref:Uncharacterized protein n=1 Tax=Sphingobacterium griseoflavum TaxID=1474952 RepID=A0ABQ3HZ13_9SPHI|nr:hypothetical protein [Sphingobacterium griseoflavum]GHE49202.1 hypothetical protein GCM10017764_35290 [Sphingobacterium griseoflavum]
MEFQHLVNDPYKGIRFRIHIDNTDFIIRLLKADITKESKEIKILMDGIPKTLRRNEYGQWDILEDPDNNRHFGQAVWNCICLRYRI